MAINLYWAILNFMGFFGSDPHPTPDICRNMVKICELHIPHKFRFAGPMIAWAVHDNECTCGGAPRRHGESEFEWRRYWRTATSVRPPN